MTRFPKPYFGAMAVALFAAGCTSFSPDGGFNSVQSLARERLDKEVRWIRSETDANSVRGSVQKLLAAPLSAETAVQIALINNRGLQATYAELGIAEADLVQAGRLRNPLFSFGRFVSGDELEIERRLVFDLLGLLSLPARSEIAAQQFERTKLQVGARVLQIAQQTRRAYFGALAAAETVKYMQQAKAASEASAELARRMRTAGNFSRLDQAREQVFYAEVTARLARAMQMETVEREKLTRVLGLWGEDIRFQLPERMPDLPKTVRELAEVEQAAIKERIDVQVAVRESDLLAKSLGLTRATSFVDALELGFERTSETDRPTKRGFELELRLPLFDWGGARDARAEHLYLQAVNRVAETAVNARSEARAAYINYRTAYDLAKHFHAEIVPLRKQISEETLLRYNGMLMSVFELLADAREQVSAVLGYIEALRDFWLADADLESALMGTSTNTVGMSMGTSSVAQPAAGH